MYMFIPLKARSLKQYIPLLGNISLFFPESFPFLFFQTASTQSNLLDAKKRKHIVTSHEMAVGGLYSSQVLLITAGPRTTSKTEIPKHHRLLRIFLFSELLTPSRNSTTRMFGSIAERVQLVATLKPLEKLISFFQH